jgi:hypothetical protein
MFLFCAFVVGLTGMMWAHRPPMVECTHDEYVERDSVIIQSVHDTPGNQPYTVIELRDAETQTICRTL